jgi:hypothetical protein
MLYTDSEVSIAKRFILNSVAMTGAQRAATGLQQYDTTVTTSTYDHLPVVVDFRFPIPGDYNGDRVVNILDFQLWRTTFGSTQNLSADGDGNLVVDAGDYVVWRKYSAAGSGAVQPGPDVPVPEPPANLLWLIAVGTIAALRSRELRPR